MTALDMACESVRKLLQEQLERINPCRQKKWTI